MATNSNEKAKHISEERTLKDLSPNAAALLCYVAGWVSGIVFLVLEQKNQYVRFHALQSIVVFGSLTVIGSILGNIPWVGAAFSAIIGVIGFILWIILMLKAYSGETFRLGWAGNVAERFTSDSVSSGVQNAAQDARYDAGQSDKAGATATDPNAQSPASSFPVQVRSSSGSKREAFRDKYYSTGLRAGRIVGSAFAIAWSIALLIFFNFFSQYIAYYQPAYSGGVTHWQITPFVTSEFNLWLPMVTTALVVGIVGHALLIAFDKYLLREITHIIINVFSLAAIVSLLAIFPFDFSVIPNVDAAYWAPIGLTITLIIIAVGIGIGTLVKLITTLVNAAEGKY